jgi:hypothetical protein
MPPSSSTALIQARAADLRREVERDRLAQTPGGHAAPPPCSYVGAPAALAARGL